MSDTASKLPINADKKSTPAQPKAWAPFDSLRHEIDRLFDNVGGGWLNRSPDLDLTWAPSADWAIAPAVDVVEKDSSYEITAELPGLDEKDIDVKFADGALTIRGEKKESREEHKKGYYVSERRYGAFARSFQLPDGTNPDKIDARFAKGVLTIVVPKSTEAAKNEKKIAVKAA